MIVDEDKQELSIRAARCSSPDYLHKLPIKIEDSLIGRVVRERQLVTVPDVAAEKSYKYPELARRSGLAALLSENARLISESLEMKHTLEARKIIERAKGILQHRHSISEKQAYLDLRSESRRLRRPMRDLAEAIVLAEELYRKGQKKDLV